MTNSAIVAGTLRVPSLRILPHCVTSFAAGLLSAPCKVTAHGVCLLLWAVSALAFPTAARADRLDEIKKRGIDF